MASEVVQMADRTQNSQMERAGDSKGSRDSEHVDRVFVAAIRANAFMLPAAAVSFTVLLYLVVGRIYEEGPYAKYAGDLAVLVGILASILVWLTVSYLYRPYTTAASVSPRNYNGLKERLDSLEIQVKGAQSNHSQTAPKNSVLETMRRQALALAERECEKIKEGLEGKGMLWVTGLGY